MTELTDLSVNAAESIWVVYNLAYLTKHISRTPTCTENARVQRISWKIKKNNCNQISTGESGGQRNIH